MTFCPIITLHYTALIQDLFSKKLVFISNFGVFFINHFKYNINYYYYYYYYYYIQAGKMWVIACFIADTILVLSPLAV